MRLIDNDGRLILHRQANLAQKGLLSDIDHDGRLILHRQGNLAQKGRLFERRGRVNKQVVMKI